MNKKEADLIITEQNKSTEEILKAVANVKADLVSKIGNQKKQIEELKAENELIKNSDSLCKLIGEQKIKITDLEWQLQEVLKDNDNYQADNEKLEKENAELKGLKDISTLIRANNDTVITLMQLNNMLVGKNQQLTKAKKIIKEFMKVTEIYLKQGDDLMEKNILRCARDMAEQFLNSEVEK